MLQLKRWRETGGWEGLNGAAAAVLCPSWSWSFPLSIRYAMSLLLFPSCLGINLLLAVLQRFLQKPLETSDRHNPSGRLWALK